MKKSNQSQGVEEPNQKDTGQSHETPNKDMVQGGEAGKLLPVSLGIKPADPPRRTSLEIMNESNKLKMEINIVQAMPELHGQLRLGSQMELLQVQKQERLECYKMFAKLLEKEGHNPQGESEAREKCNFCKEYLKLKQEIKILEKK